MINHSKDSDCAVDVQAGLCAVEACADFCFGIQDCPTKGVAVTVYLSPLTAQLVVDALTAMEPSGDDFDCAYELAWAITKRLQAVS